MRIEDLKSRIVEHLKNAEEAYQEYEEDPTRKNFNNLAMECFQVVNYAISLMERIVEEKELGYALSYRDLVDKLVLAGVLNKDSAKDIKALIRFRNKIAHEYYTISPDELEEMYSLLHAVEVLV